MRLSVWILLALVLAGCASEPIIEVRTVEVPVPTWEPCAVEMPPLQFYAAERIKSGTSDFDKIKIVLVERSQRIRMEQELRALLGVCTDRH